MVNAWEEGDWITMDGCFQPDPTIRRDPSEGQLGSMLAYLRYRGHLRRWRMNMRTGEKREQQLDDANVEFCLPDTQLYGVKTRYSYHQRVPTDMQTLVFDGLVKYDHETARAKSTSTRKAGTATRRRSRRALRRSRGSRVRGHDRDARERLQVGSVDLRRAAHQQGPDRSRRAAGPRADRLPRSMDSGPPVVAVTHPPWFDPGMPRREDCVLKAILDDRAARVPDRRWRCSKTVLSGPGAKVANRLARRQRRCRRSACARGSCCRVVAERSGLVRAWFAINYLGAVFVPLNTAYRGASLQHTINACRAKLVLAHAALVERFEGLSLQHVERVIVLPQTDLMAMRASSTTPRSRSRGTRSP
jgi:hypothetical protein